MCPDVGEAFGHPPDQVPQNVRLVLGEVGQHLGDGLAMIGNFEGLRLKSITATSVTVNVHVREKIHLHFDRALPATALTATTLDVKGEAARLIHTQSCLWI